MEAFGDAFLRQQRLLVVAPHPDGESLGCAGTIARVKALGGETCVVIISAGGVTWHERLDTAPQRELVERIEYTASLSLERLRPSMVLTIASARKPAR